MSKRSHTACYVHLIWGTRDRKPFLSTEETQKKVNQFFYTYLNELNIRVLALHAQPDHTHFLIELPVERTIKDIVKLLKGSSSHWINQNDITRSKFSWAVGYTAFTVSKSNALPTPHAWLTIKFLCNSFAFHSNP